VYKGHGAKQLFGSTEHKHQFTKSLTEILDIGRDVQALVNRPQLVSKHLEHDVDLKGGRNGCVGSVGS